ncbi:hypothetical protein B5D77_24935 [Microcystis sp. MC19]|nr:hypothetical protein B5D77_24935 [Microcystis sp. MC19]
MIDHISTVDLFCGAGGLTHGFEKAGLIVKAGYDIDPACQFPYEHNNKAQFILKNNELRLVSFWPDHLSLVIWYIKFIDVVL